MSIRRTTAAAAVVAVFALMAAHPAFDSAAWAMHGPKVRRSPKNLRNQRSQDDPDTDDKNTRIKIGTDL